MLKEAGSGAGVGLKPEKDVGLRAKRLIASLLQ